MTARIEEISTRIYNLEKELHEELSRHKDELTKDFENKRLQFEHEVFEQQERFKVGVLKYLWTADIRSICAIPFIYSLIAPFFLLDLFVSLYQRVCFPLFGIKSISRSEYIIFDRSHLAYLNIIEKINCAYCSYVNGLIAYMREVAGKTEQYWCPIKHAKKAYLAHPYYKDFAEYGDAKSYQQNLGELRQKLRESEEY